MTTPQTNPISRPTYRLVVYCVLVGLVGALAALGFDALVELTQGVMLEGIGHYQPPSPHAPERVAIPQGLSRLWLPLVTTLGGLLSGWVVYRWTPEASNPRRCSCPD